MRRHPNSHDQRPQPAEGTTVPLLRIAKRESPCLEWGRTANDAVASQIDETDPLAINQTLRVGALLPDGLKLLAIGAADPTRSSDPQHMKRVEDALAKGAVKALKCYLGYLPFGPEHEARLPYYELAKKYKIPVIFHTGDTYSRKARLRFAHPLPVDE